MLLLYLVADGTGASLTELSISYEVGSREPGKARSLSAPHYYCKTTYEIRDTIPISYMYPQVFDPAWDSDMPHAIAIYKRRSLTEASQHMYSATSI